MIKADLDVFLTLPELLSAISSPSNPPAFLYGKRHYNNHVIRNFKLDPKWYVPEYLYAEDLYPPYMGGPAYAVSRQAAECVIKSE